jgi:hypothetical protein
MATRKDNIISLDELDPFDLEGTLEDIALVERMLAIMARKQVVWSAVVEEWKKRAGISTTRPAASVPHDASPSVVRETGISNLAALIELYRVDQRSAFHKVHFSTRGNYNNLLRQLERELGHIELARCKAEAIQNAFDGWVKTGNVAMPHNLVTMLRGLFGFGSTILGDSECERISVIMHNMRFPMIQARTIHRMTPDQAIAIIEMAHKKKLHSMALGQAIQFEIGLKQKDVIGDWVPITEPGDSEIKTGSLKWTRGLRWGDLDPSRLLECPMVRAAIDKITTLKIPGQPMIVYEKTRLPYLLHQWRHQWRELATEAGLPKAVYNMDSRGRRISAKTANGQAPQGTDNVSDAAPKSESRH